MKSRENFFDYFPMSAKARTWGIYSTTFGQGRIPPGSPYPPMRHPDGHHFVWEQGRILHEYHLVYISEGQGWFESSRTRLRKIRGGTAFLLFPGMWHRYRPDPATGWTEWWIDLQGAQVNRLHRVGVIDPGRPVYRVESGVEMENLWSEAGRLARVKPRGFTVQLGLLALQILTLLEWKSARRFAAPRRLDRVIVEAQALLAQDLEQPVSPEAISRRLGVGYSYFRRMFKQQTGLSPKKYAVEIRHRRTRDLLRSTSHTIKEIAGQLGYHSPYHLSLDFSKRAGLSPSRWRSGVRNPKSGSGN